MADPTVSPLLPLPSLHTLGHLTVSPAGPLAQRVITEQALGRPAAMCVPLLLQQDAVQALHAMTCALNDLSLDRITPAEARHRANATILAWNAQVSVAQGLLQAAPPPPRRRWWAWFLG